MFMDSEKFAHLSVPVASRARPESELGCSGGPGDVTSIAASHILGASTDLYARSVGLTDL